MIGAYCTHPILIISIILVILSKYDKCSAVGFIKLRGARRE